MKNISVRSLIIGEGLPKICVGFYGEDFDLAEQMYQRIKDEPADILEWRVDSLLGGAFRDVEKIDRLITKIREEDDRPLILTLRTEDEGGLANLLPRDYSEIIRSYTDSQADILDIEAFVKDDDRDEDVTLFLGYLAKENGKAIILSNHDFTFMPKEEEIVRRLVKMAELGADIPKAAYMAATEEDARVMLAASEEASAILTVPFITMAMGEEGKITRLAGGMFGSCITYAASEIGATAPGQIKARDMQRYLREFYR